jgi:hypothetical protein
MGTSDETGVSMGSPSTTVPFGVSTVRLVVALGSHIDPTVMRARRGTLRPTH